MLAAPTVIPQHYEGWTRATQGADAPRAAFAGNGIADRLALVAPGARAAV